MDMPLNRRRAREMAAWLKTNFGAQIEAALAGTPFSMDIACAIVCQETGLYLLGFTKTRTVDEALSLCVFDASGDVPSSPRGAFPRNTAEFRREYGNDFTQMLIDEANTSRRIRGMSDGKIVYKGYGLFQYDLQHVKTDQAFFENRLWYDFAECLARLKRELMAKYATVKDVDKAIRAYNGSGPRAEAYLANVKVFIRWCSEV